MLRNCATLRYVKKLSELVREIKGERIIDQPRVFLGGSEKSPFEIDMARKT